MGRGEGKSTTTRKSRRLKEPEPLTTAKAGTLQPVQLFRETGEKQGPGAAIPGEREGQRRSSHFAAPSREITSHLDLHNLSQADEIAQKAIRNAPDAPSQSRALTHPRTDSLLDNAGNMALKRMLETETARQFLQDSQDYQTAARKWLKDGGEEPKPPRFTPEYATQIQKKALPQLQEKAEKAKAYLTTVDDAKLPGQTPLAFLEDMYSGLDASDDAKSAHLQMALALAIHQHADNPEQYVSHGLDHTINTLKQTRQIIADNPVMVRKTMDKYDISDAEAKFLLQSVSLFHDFGYPFVGNRDRSAHAIAGGDILNDRQVQEYFRGIIKSNAGTGKQKEMLHDLRDAIVLHAADRVNTEYSTKLKTTHGTFLVSDQDFVDVLSEFERDTGNSNMTVTLSGGIDRDAFIQKINEYRNKNARRLGLSEQEYRDKFGEIEVIPSEAKSFGGISSDIRMRGDKKYGIEHLPVNMFKEPLIAVLRMSDALDISPARLSPMQRTAEFQEIIARLGETGSEDNETRESALKAKEIEENVRRARLVAEDKGLRHNSEQWQTAQKALTDAQNAEKDFTAKIVEGVLGKSSLANTDKEKLRQLAGQTNHQSFRHFAGLLPVQAIRIKNNAVNVTVDKAKLDALNKTRIDVYGNKMGVGDFQLWYAKNTLGSVHTGKTVGGEGIPIRVKFIDSATGEEIKEMFKAPGMGEEK